MRRLVWLLLAGGGCGGQLAPGGDASIDAPGSDASVDVAADGSLTSACAAAGGEVCTANRWILCPVGYEPVSQSDNYGCGFGPPGWCCKPAPPSPCTQSGTGNCIDSCGGPITATGCWIVSVPLACESGKVCCADGCD